MMKTFILKQIRILQGAFKDKLGLRVVTALFLFLVLNALKITLFNFYMIPNRNMEIFAYKFWMTLLLFLVVYPFVFVIKNRLIFCVVYILQFIYLLTNISYYLYFHSYLHLLQWIALFNEAFISTKHFSNPKSAELLIAFIDFPVFIYLVMTYSKIHVVRAKFKFFRALMIVLSCMTLFSIETYNYAEGHSIVQFINDRYKGESPIVERYGTVANGVVSLLKNQGEKEYINQFKYGKELVNTKETKEKPNFVIIQVESMDSNVINQKYKDRYIAPFLHSLSDQSIYYPYVLSYHKGGGTSDTEFSITNSVEPVDGFPAIKLSNYNYPNSMLSSLTGESYHTVAFHGNLGSFFNRDTAFPKMGFQEFYDMPKMNMKDVGWGAPDAQVFNFASNRIKDMKQPFLSYVITMTSHGPFDSVKHYYNNDYYQDITDENVRNYFNSMSYVDQSIQEFVTYIRENVKNTYILIWGDHTPNINTDLYKQASFIIGDTYFEFVPLLIVTPEGKMYKEDKKVASFLDISPTILYTSGVNFTIRSDGQNLIIRDGSSNTIPLKGNDYDREYLFSKVNGK